MSSSSDSATCPDCGLVGCAGCLDGYGVADDPVPGKCPHCGERWTDHGGVEEPICRDERERT